MQAASGLGRKFIPARTVIWGAGVQASPAKDWLGAEADRARIKGGGPQVAPFRYRKMGNLAAFGRNAEIIDSLVRNLIENSYGKDHLAFSNEVFQALHDLLEFNREHIYFNQKIKVELPKIRNIFSMLFDRYMEDYRQNNRSSALFTYFLRDNMAAYIEETPPGRAVIDFLAGMTDRFMVDQFRRTFLPHSLGYQAPGE